MNFRRAGVLKKRSRTAIVVPCGPPASSTASTLPPAISMRVPVVSSGGRVTSSSREIDAIDGSASPRKPSVAIDSRSSLERIFEVACSSKASSASSRTMPQPSSVTRISLRPPASTSTRMRVAPASSAFSSSSLTTDAGRSTTSPAAIWLATWSERTRMRPMVKGEHGPTEADNCRRKQAVDSVVRIGLLIEPPGAGEVLHDVAERLVDGDLLGRPAALNLAALDAAGEHLTDLANDVAVVDQSGLFGAEELCALGEHALAAVDVETRRGDQRVVDLGRAGVAGAHDVDVCARSDPCGVEDGLLRRGDGADDVGLRDGLLNGGRCLRRDV